MQFQSAYSLLDLPWTGPGLKGFQQPLTFLLIVSHVLDEAGIIIKSWVDTSAAFTEFLNYAFPGECVSGIRASIDDYYPSAGPPFYGDQQARLKKAVQDSTFLCNSRQLYNAYKGKTYVLQYFPRPPTHGSDLLASTYHQGLDVGDVLKSFMENTDSWLIDHLKAIIPPFADPYQRYLAAHALYGDPNRLGNGVAEAWDIANDDNGTINNALRAGVIGSGGLFNSDPDNQIPTEDCEFWKEVAEVIDILPLAEENSSGDESVVFNGLSGVRVQAPEKDTPVIPEL